MDFIHQVEPYSTGHEARAVSDYLNSGGWLTEFRKTEEFERKLAGFLGKKHVVAVTSGTAALYLSLIASGVGKGDRVIVPNYTMIATVNAVRWVGAEPVIVDVEPSTLCMDMGQIKPDSSCKALIYVSINGRSGDMESVARFCKENGLVLLEDACQALGSKWGGRHLGTFGDIGVFSFTPHKIITTGQGGAVVTDNAELCEKVRKLKDFHRTAPATDWHDGLGFNFKFTDLQAVVGMEQLKTIDLRIKKKKKIFKQYEEMLSSMENVHFLPTDSEEIVPWFADIFLPSEEARDGLRGYLEKNGIGSRQFYPPINHQQLYSSSGRGSFPVSESLAYMGLWLPSSIGLDEPGIERVAGAVTDYCRNL